ncbi:hypothetical protein ACIBQ1_55215 [Nonomuraea sp. NPDC050153]|uniref:hypothetical protein n=1 Tax=Nonomuraea sp. NPDC050153 TaxID=3364359 RepID=UPI0037BC350C
MNVEAEILDLKLRVEALEATLRSDGSLDRRPRHNDIVPAQSGPHRRDLPPHVTQASIDAAELRAEIADVRTEVSQDFEALIVEVAGLRLQMNQNFKTVRSDLLGKIDSLRCEMIDLGLRLDRLLEPGGA